MGSINNKTITIADMNGDKIADQVFLNYVNGKFNGASWKDGTKLADPKAVCTRIQTQTDSYGNLFFYADAKVITNPNDQEDSGFDGVKDKVVIQGVMHFGVFSAGNNIIDSDGNLKLDARADQANESLKVGGYLDVYKFDIFKECGSAASSQYGPFACAYTKKDSYVSPQTPDIVVQLKEGPSFTALIKKYDPDSASQYFKTINLDGKNGDDNLLIQTYTDGKQNGSKYQGEIWLGYTSPRA